MSDFQNTDINELLNEKPKPQKSEYDLALEQLRRDDWDDIHSFTPKGNPMSWPSPVKKRHLR